MDLPPLQPLTAGQPSQGSGLPPLTPLASVKPSIPSLPPLTPLGGTSPATKTTPGASSPSNSPSLNPAFAGVPYDQYFKGNGYGASNITDPASGKPLLTFENEKAQKSQLLSDRTDVTFDPTKAQKVDPKLLQNPRMKESVSQTIKKSIGGNAFTELDHIMPLELGGSNTQSNLHLESGQDPSKPYSGKNPTPTDPIENQIADQVHNGDKTGVSLLDGWRLMAKAKGITLTEDKKPAQPYGSVSLPLSTPGNTASTQKTQGVLSAIPNKSEVDRNTASTPALKDTLENAITQFAPFQILARVAGGQDIFKAIAEQYGPRNYSAFSADDINKIIETRQKLIDSGTPAAKAATLATKQVSSEKLKTQITASVFPEADLTDTAKVIEDIAKSSDPAAIAESLKKLPNVSKEISPLLSRVLAKIDDPVSVQKVIDTFSEEPKTSTARALDKGIENAKVAEEKSQAKITTENQIAEKASTAQLPPRDSFLQKLKNVLNPIAGQDPEVKIAFEDYQKKIANALPAANDEARKLTNIPADAGMDTILKYERGSPGPYTEQIMKQFEGLYDEARARGLDTEHRTNYLPHAYAETPEQIRQVMRSYLIEKGVPESQVEDFLMGKQELPQTTALRLGLNPFFTKTRMFPTYQEAIDAGLHPRYTHPAQLAGLYRETMEHNIANRELVTQLEKSGKLLTAENVPPGYKAVNLEFSPKGYYAKPRLAQMLNGLFNDEAGKSFWQSALGITGKVSRAVQKIELTTGVPKTSVNVHTIGQVIKEITAGDFSKIGAFIRANSDAASVRYFEANRDVLKRMADQGFDLGHTVADYPNLYKNFLQPDLTSAFKRGGPRSAASYIAKETGTTFDNIFTKKNFSSFMPQLYVSTFKDAAERFASQGMPQKEADALAVDVVRSFHGLIGNVGRARGTEDALSTAFFAPKFRESIVNTLWNSARSLTTEISNPAFYKNRRLAGGMALSFGLYTGANKFLNGHYIWQNPSTHQFDLQIPTGNGNYAYLPFMPTFMAVPRNLLGGALSTASGDLRGATQQFSSVLSAPLQLFGQLYANKDFFGRPIYNDTDTGAVKAQKIASYLGLNLVPPFVKETVNYIAKKGQTPLYQSITTGMELPIKYGSDAKNNSSAFGQAMQNYAALHAQAMAAFKPTFDQIQTLVQQGKNDEATKMVNALSEGDYTLYKDLKAGATRSTTSKGEAQFLPTYQQIKSLVQQGKNDQAQQMLNGLSAQEYKYYELIKKKGL